MNPALATETTATDTGGGQGRAVDARFVFKTKPTRVAAQAWTSDTFDFPPKAFSTASGTWTARLRRVLGKEAASFDASPSSVSTYAVRPCRPPGYIHPSRFCRFRPAVQKLTEPHYR